MPGFDCVVPMIDPNVPVFFSLSLALLKIYFSGGKLEKTSCCKGFVLSQPVKFWGRVCRGESVREGEARGGKSKPPVNWWYAQGLEGPNTDLVPKGTWKFDTALQFRAAA